jgi:hypothetical protein
MEKIFTGSRDINLLVPSTMSRAVSLIRPRDNKRQEVTRSNKKQQEQ